MAGVISAVVQIAYCISFAALIFTGDLAGGFPLGLAGLIMGTVVTCVVIAVTSTFSPVIGGPDSPAALRATLRFRPPKAGVLYFGGWNEVSGGGW